MDWGLILHIASTLVLVAVSWGVMSTRVQYLEKLVEELRSEVKDFRRLSEDLAVVKHEVHSIRDLLIKVIKEDK